MKFIFPSKRKVLFSLNQFYSEDSQIKHFFSEFMFTSFDEGYQVLNSN